MVTTKFEPGGVSVYPYPAGRGDLVTISYNGLLANSGADQVYMFAGYGPTWKDEQFIRMMRTNSGWERTIAVEHMDSLNFCFKDSANNWDNNNNYNWYLPIH